MRWVAITILLLFATGLQAARYGVVPWDFCEMCWRWHANVPVQHARSMMRTSVQPATTLASTTGRWEQRCINGVCRIVWVQSATTPAAVAKPAEPTPATITHHPPVVADDNETIIEAPTPVEVIEHVCSELIEWRADDVFYDIGCGDGRWLEAVAAYPIRRVIGIERVAARVALARRRLARYGSKAYVMRGDATKLDLSKATVAVMYLNPDTIACVVPRLRRARVIISYQNEIPLPGVQRVIVRNKPVYIWRRPVVERWQFPVYELEIR